MRACAGVGRSDVGTSRMWYRRNFTVPQDWEVAAGLQGSSAKRLLLHFGAVDWEAWGCTEAGVWTQSLANHYSSCCLFARQPTFITICFPVSLEAHA
jgi:hypothetical protein